MTHQRTAIDTSACRTSRQAFFLTAAIGSLSTEGKTLETLSGIFRKMQGVADITDAAIVIRLKFTSKPNQASTLQREALKRVYRSLNEARVPFASNAVTVKEGSGRDAAAAIATVGPPTPLAPVPG